MIRITLDSGWTDEDLIAEHINGWDEVKPLFDGWDARRAVTEGCGLDFDEVVRVTKLIATTKSAIHQDLGIYMNRNSTINNYMLQIFRMITGRFGVEGGQVVPAFLYAIGGNSDERNPKIGRSPVTGMFPIYSVFPPAIFPAETLSDNPNHTRAVIVSAVNPLRTWPDTKAYEKAFRSLDLSVCIDTAFSETARECDYVLPCRSYMLSADIRKRLGSFELNVKFEAANETLALLGASGSGKSVTLRCLAGILKPDAGRIVLNGRVLFDSDKRINLSPQERRIGYLFQQYALFPNMICPG